MHVQKLMAMLAICGWLFTTTPTTDAAANTPSDLRAAKKQKNMAGGGSIQGIVIDHHKKSVAGATVRIVHSLHHKSHSTAANKPAAKAVNAKKPAAKHHHKSTAITGAGGTFTLKASHGGAHIVKAHKKGVGSGHATAMVGGKKAAKVVIRLHKHHRHHSGVKAKK